MQVFGGIPDKLLRAKENIDDLESEIRGFFEKCDYPTLPNDDREMLLKAIEYHKNLPIPPRFSVLAGEVIHHLRSCFDHIAWHFSDKSAKNVRRIEFPVFEDKPINHQSRSRYEGKIKGIANTDAINLIESLQPYHSPQPTDTPLGIIHNFDIVDKHRELVVCVATGSTMFPIEMQPIIEAYQREHPELDPARIARNFRYQGTLMPCVSFRDFGRREIHPVIPGLTELFNYTVGAVKRFQVL